MKLLVYDFSSFTIEDVKAALTRLGIDYRVYEYCLVDPEHNPYLAQCTADLIDRYCPDAVFSVNFTPVIAQVCLERGLPYIAWSYDSPNPVWQMERFLPYETNYTFLFDRAEVERYRRMGIANIWHLPCAVDVGRLDRIAVDACAHARFDSEVSMLGQLYSPDELENLCRGTDAYTRGYIMGAVDSQLGHYGKYVLGDMEMEIADMINRYNRSIGRDAFTSPYIVRINLSRYVSRMERLAILGEIGERHEVALWSGDRDEYLDGKVDYRGSVHYYTEMPLVFKCSRINLNITLKSIETALPLRAVDILGSGGFLLSNYQEELEEYVGDGEGCAIFHNLGEAVEKADYYLEHESERVRIAARGREIAQQRFSYDEAFRHMLGQAGLRI